MAFTRAVANLLPERYSLEVQRVSALERVWKWRRSVFTWRVGPRQPTNEDSGSIQVCTGDECVPLDGSEKQRLADL